MGWLVMDRRMFDRAELVREETGPGRLSDQFEGFITLYGQYTEHSLIGLNWAAFLVAVSNESFVKDHHQCYIDKAIDFGL